VGKFFEDGVLILKLSDATSSGFYAMDSTSSCCDSPSLNMICLQAMLFFVFALIYNLNIDISLHWPYDMNAIY
jgi:hypothetical protein